MGYVYALAKLRVSLEIFSVPTIHLDPTSNENMPKSDLPEDHVRLVLAVIAVWSCVEELRFSVGASTQKPSRLPDGAWNPPVKADLENRVRRGGVDLAESFPWNLRDPRTRIGRRRHLEVTSTLAVRGSGALMGGGATPLLLKDLKVRDAISIPATFIK
jgi:hypothetical protein